MQKQILFAILIFACGAAAASIVLTGLSEPAPGAAQSVAGVEEYPGQRRVLDDVLQERIAELAAALDREREARELLTEEVASLEEQFSSMYGQSATADQLQVVAASRTSSPERRSSRRQAGIERRAAEVGYTVEEVSRLQRRADEIASQQSFERNRRRSQRLAEMLAPQLQLESELGVFDYDRYRYVTGMPNRVEVAGLSEGLPGDVAGLESGDLFYSLDGERVYSTEQVIYTLISGEPETPIIAEVHRDGQPIQVVLPRGRIGAQLTPRRVNPADNP